jgi:hypothetical protein
MLPLRPTFREQENAPQAAVTLHAVSFHETEFTRAPASGTSTEIDPSGSVTRGVGAATWCDGFHSRHLTVRNL